MSDARAAALAVLERCRKTKAWSETMLDTVIRRENLDPRDAALCSRICYGVIQNQSLLDFYIGQFSTTPVKKIEPKVLDVLRLSAYQLIFMDKIPASAAVSSGVNLAKNSGIARASGFINAVLRKIAASVDNLPEPEGKGTAAYLALRYSHPLWLAEEMIAQRGYADAEAFFAANNDTAPITAQVNTLKTDAATLQTALTAQGISIAAHPHVPNCLIFANAGRLAELPEMQNGHFYIQDAAAKMAILAADPKPGMVVLDACSAPGGKSFAAAIAMENKGSITSCDLHENKLTRIRAGAERLGLDILKIHPMDASGPLPEYEKAFDLIIADVPCSGIGVIRKKPEIRFKSREELERLPEIQLNILRAMARCVKPGGTLLYSTCTVRSCENEAVVRAFLAENPEYHPEAFDLPGIGPVEGMLTLWPQIHGTDGFFIAKLRRMV